MADTVIGEGTKIDNLVQIAHNVRIGRGCVIAAPWRHFRLGDDRRQCHASAAASALPITSRSATGAQLAAGSGV